MYPESDKSFFSTKLTYTDVRVTSFWLSSSNCVLAKGCLRCILTGKQILSVTIISEKNFDTISLIRWNSLFERVDFFLPPPGDVWCRDVAGERDCRGAYLESPKPFLFFLDQSRIYIHTAWSVLSDLGFSNQSVLSDLKDDTKKLPK